MPLCSYRLCLAKVDGQRRASNQEHVRSFAQSLYFRERGSDFQKEKLWLLPQIDRTKGASNQGQRKRDGRGASERDYEPQTPVVVQRVTSAWIAKTFLDNVVYFILTRCRQFVKVVSR